MRNIFILMLIIHLSLHAGEVKQVISRRIEELKKDLKEINKKDEIALIQKALIRKKSIPVKN